jgi:hypothetical protein
MTPQSSAASTRDVVADAESKTLSASRLTWYGRVATGDEFFSLC